MAPARVIGSGAVDQRWKHMNPKVVVSRDTHGDEPRAAFEDALTKLCVGQGLDVLLVPDLYHLPDEHTVWDAIMGCRVIASWHYVRPIGCLLGSHGFAGIPVLHLGGYASAEECCSAIVDAAGGPGAHAGTISEAREPVSERWYPIIDASRCANCGHCLQFCIFDVYAYDADGRVVAANPDNCKHGCPACSRICPESAIIFACYRKDPAIAGAPGGFVKPDASARRMFYARTKQPCPVCGRVYDQSSARSEMDAEVCRECGMPVADRPRKAQPSREALDDVDILIDDLERLTRRKP